MPTNPAAQYLTEDKVVAALCAALPAYLERQRWFTSKGHGVSGLELEILPAFGAHGVLTLLKLKLSSGTEEVRVLPIAFAISTAQLPSHAIICELDTSDGPRSAYDAVHAAGFRESLYDFMASGQRLAGSTGTLIAERGPLLTNASKANDTVLPPQNSSNTVIVYPPDGFLKLFRKTEPGLHPDAELIGYLSADRGFGSVPAFGGALHYQASGESEPSSLALLIGRVDHNGEAWETMLARVEAFAKTYRAYDRPPYDFPAASLLDPLRPAEIPADIAGDIGADTVARIELLGRRTAEMHLHFAAADEDGLRPRALDEDYWASAKTQLQTRLVQEQKDAGPELADTLGELNEWLDQDLPKVDAGTIRVHGDYHLGQVLDTDEDVVIIDFEGEPLHSLAYRRRRHPAFKDVAGMLCSLHYAPYAYVNQSGSADPTGLAGAKIWYNVASRLFLTAYLEGAAGAAFLPTDRNDQLTVLSFFLIDKALYELAYERASRPDWLQIPVAGILQVGEMLSEPA